MSFSLFAGLTYKWKHQWKNIAQTLFEFIFKILAVSSLFLLFFFFALTHTENTKYTWCQTTDWSLQRGRSDSILIMHVFIYVQKIICIVITKCEVSLGLLYCLQWGEVSSVLSVEVARLLVQGYTSVCMLYLLQAPAAWGRVGRSIPLYLEHCTRNTPVYV